MIPIMIAAAIIFIILREFFCWFWKMNKIVELLEEQNKNILLLSESQNRLNGIIEKMAKKELATPSA